MLNRQSGDFIARFARLYKVRSASLVLLLILSGLAEGIGIVALLPVLQTAGGGGNADDPVTGLLRWLGVTPTLTALLLTVVFAIFLKACFTWLAMQQVGFSVAKIGLDLRRRLIRALMHVRWTYFTSQPTGFFPNAVATEASRASNAYRKALGALAGAIQVIVYAGIIVAVSWKIAVASLVLGGMVAAVMSLFIGMSRRAGGDQTHVMKSLLVKLTDALQSIKPIKAMGREARFELLLDAEIEALQEAEKRQVIASESLRSFQEPFITLIIALGLLAAVRWGQISFSEVLVIAFLFHRLTGRFHFVQLEYQTLAAGESAYWSLENLTRAAEMEAEPTSLGHAQAPILAECIQLQDVTFSYGEHVVLDDLCLTVPSGRFVAIVGPSGGGKTTIIDLIAGLHQPMSGEIRIDGVPLQTIEMSSWRRQIGYVPQEPVLFHDSVFRNVGMSSDDVTRQQVEEALAQADALEFVMSLPEGLDAVIGERGSKLSGGQRQRLAIARALVGRPRLLVLDEATTALDPVTEAAICATLGKLRGSVTVLAISHQTAVQGVADAVYELRDRELHLVSPSDRSPRSVRAGGH